MQRLKPSPQSKVRWLRMTVKYGMIRTIISSQALNCLILSGTALSVLLPLPLLLRSLSGCRGLRQMPQKLVSKFMMAKLCRVGKKLCSLEGGGENSSLPETEIHPFLSFSLVNAIYVRPFLPRLFSWLSLVYPREFLAIQHSRSPLLMFSRAA